MAGDDLVLTPGGYRPRANVHRVGRDQFVRLNGDAFEIHHRDRGLVEAVDGFQRHSKTHPLLPRELCKLRPRRAPFANTGRLRGASAVGEMNGWISYASWQNATGNPISQLTTTWTTPEEPVNKGKQTIFLFNGLQNADMIYQPVLQWGSSAAGGGQKWSVACWYVDSPAGQSFCSLLVDVSPGRQLVGVMSLVAQNGALCSYTSKFEGLPDASLPIHNVDELTWACETLEAYAVSERNDFPASGATTFSSNDLSTTGGTPSVSWTLDTPYSASGYQATIVTDGASGGQIKITY